MNDTKLKMSLILRVEKLGVERTATSTRPFGKIGEGSNKGFLLLASSHINIDHLQTITVVVVDIFKTSMRPVTSSVETACTIQLT